MDETQSADTLVPTNSSRRIHPIIKPGKQLTIRVTADDGLFSIGSWNWTDETENGPDGRVTLQSDGTLICFGEAFEFGNCD